MESAQVRIFPTSRDEFPLEASLTTWLLTALRGRGGVYHLRSADRMTDLPPGSVVLFRYGGYIVGEAVVVKPYEMLQEPIRERTLTGTEAEYRAQVTFAPSSVRLYAPPVPVERIQSSLDKDVVKFPGAYTKLGWEDYGRVLQLVASGGAFVA